MSYSESDLVAPALRVLAARQYGAKTSDLIEILTTELSPTGEDAAILSGRSDSHFSQKVRNLKSHNRLTKDGLATYEDGIYRITEKGRAYLLSDSVLIAESLRDQGFDESIRNAEFEKGYADIIIEEGALLDFQGKRRARSKKLTEMARDFFAAEGKIGCKVCGFDFNEIYGTRGEGYIEIHHQRPIHTYEIEGQGKTVADAIANLSPLCSNCHRMVHRGGKLMSVEELRDLVIKKRTE